MAVIQRAYKTALKPSKAQEAKLLHYSNVVRSCYNLFLSQSEDEYARTGKRPFTRVLIKQFRASRPEWTTGACSRCEETAARMLDGGYKKFFEHIKAGKLPEMQKGKRPRKDGKPHGFPRFKSRFDAPPACKFWGVKPDDVRKDAIRLQGLGWIKLHEKGYLPTEGAKANCVTVSCRAGRWFVSLQLEEEAATERARGAPVGVDVGVKTLAVTSDGRCFENPKALRRSLRQLARLNRKLARQEKRSSRRADTKEHLGRLYYRIVNVRQDATHKATAEIIGVKRPAEERPAAVGIETLNVNGMLKNRRLSRAISDANLSELHRQLRYKAEWHGSSIIEADRFYPSSKTCSECGHVLPALSLSERTFRCPECGAVRDRDENAAANLEKLCEA